MRPIAVIKDTSVCQDTAALRDPTKQSLADFRAEPKGNCPLFEQCLAGKLLGPQLRGCIPLMGHQVARFASEPGGALGAEMQDFAASPAITAKLGFIDPYKDANPDSTITNRTEIAAQVEAWAKVVMDGEPASLDRQVQGAHCPRHQQFTTGCPECQMARLVVVDRTAVVMPGGVAQRVARGQCRCPIVRVGDYCPVHGG